MFKIYDRGADRGHFRFCVVERADRWRVGDTVIGRYGDRDVPGRVRCAGRPYGGARPVQNYYLELDAAELGAPDRVTPDVEQYRAQRAANPSADDVAERRAWAERMTAARRRKCEARRSRLRAAIADAGGREAFAERERVTLAWIRRALGE